MTVTEDHGSSVSPGGDQWRPIETADKSEDAAPIDVWLVAGPGRQWRVADVIWDGNDWVSDNDGERVEWGQKVRITHWMPLPSPPANVGAVETRERMTDEQ